MSTLGEQDLRRRVQRIETLIQGVGRFSDPQARAQTREIVQGLLDFHGAGLGTILDQIAATGDSGLALIDALARDDLVASLLLLYGLHPLDLETRVGQALDTVRPYLQSHRGNVELVSITDGVVRLRMQGSCDGCPSSAMTLELAIEEAIYEKAPDVAGIEVEGAAPRQAGSSLTFVPVEHLLGATSPRPARGRGWEEVDGLSSLTEGTARAQDVLGRSILVCRLAGTLYAYENTCPGCGGELDGSRLQGTTLVCAGCGQSYDIPRAGRGLDDPNLHLAPFPLLEEHDQVKVALPC